MRRIGVVTSARSDYGSCLPVLRAIESAPDMELRLVVTGTHLSPEFGYTVREVEADGFAISDRVEALLSSDTPEGMVKSAGLTMIGLAQTFARLQLDMLLLVGDRYELLAAGAAALPFHIPLAHVSGGDLTEGAIDNQVRHAITKMSHLHFVSMPLHALRLRQMGEEAWRVHITGEPALDVIHQMQLLTRAELAGTLGLELDPPLLVVTQHPTTLAPTAAAQEIDNLLDALSHVEGTLVFTYPNADAQSRAIIERIREFVAFHPRAALCCNLGQRRYYSVLSHADLMIGNSSSGIWEAPTFRLPVVNVGDRQRGRLQAGNVVDVAPESSQILAAIRRGLEPTFRASLRELKNPYGDGQASSRIIETVRHVDLGMRLLQKRFVDFVVQAEAEGEAGELGPNLGTGLH